jgi:hypothetical protein
VITATYVGGPLDGEAESREPGDTPPRLRTWTRTPLGPCPAIYTARREPDKEGRLVYEWDRYAEIWN